MKKLLISLLILSSCRAEKDLTKIPELDLAKMQVDTLQISSIQQTANVQAKSFSEDRESRRTRLCAIAKIELDYCQPDLTKGRLINTKPPSPSVKKEEKKK